ncbi:ROK family protein [Fusibacter sp. 3D3]|uniref:ROK family protein n=1 Tax=Fusibacter sp. 3D3 TaxID=1048380 RepID=UPI0008536639|nr:ROK family protein [Fusibacter sp. 3D3]GAU78817.1 putative ROK-family transcriptional regulator [Fusibacter sp. 3D3]
MKYLIGVDVGGTKIAYGLFDENKELIANMKIDSDASISPEAFFDLIIDHIYKLLKNQQLTIADVLGIGMGLPSYVHFEEGYIVKTGSLPRLHHFPLKRYLQEQLGNEIKIVIDNDGHAGALAEYRYGVGKQYNNFVYCPVSTGISSSFIINGEVFRGSYGWSGESGHMLTGVNLNKRNVCGCDNPGCFNSQCSGKMIVNSVLEWIENGEKTIMTELAGGINYITAEHIDKAFDMDDVLAKRAVEQMAQYMAIWLFNIYMILNINCFVFSGGLLSMGDKLFGRVKTLFNSYNNIDYPVYFLEAKLGDQSGVIGAMELLF